MGMAQTLKQIVFVRQFTKFIHMDDTVFNRLYIPNNIVPMEFQESVPFDVCLNIPRAFFRYRLFLLIGR